ncbi:hypothetical protein niasHS_014017 [Heterodera schachtii]|uniref:G-protein coupled receptors family 1 profile domain-containing protein n=1 Tax=Heterodera schachtii TaxID=97005 RepID=A0ABD2IQ97_HETSC
MDLLNSLGSSSAAAPLSSSSSSIFTNPNSTLVVVVKQYQQQQQLNNHHHNHHNHAAAAAAVLLPFNSNNNNNLTDVTTELAHATVHGGGDRHSDHFADGTIILFHGAAEWCPNVSNAVVWPSCITLAEALAMALFLLIVMLVIVLGNLMVVLTVSNDTKMRNQRQNWLLVSLAMADLLVGLLVMPLTLIYEIVGVWVLGSVLCELWLALDVLFVTASILHICIISLDRYWSVTQPLSYPAKRTPRRISVMIGVAWMVSLLICFPPLLGWRPKRRTGECTVSTELDYVLYSSLGSFYIPVAILVVVYMRIYMITKRHSQQRLKDTQRMGQTLCQLTSGGGGGSGANAKHSNSRMGPAAMITAHRVAEAGGGRANSGGRSAEPKRQIKFSRSIPLSVDDMSSTDPSTSVWQMPTTTAAGANNAKAEEKPPESNAVPKTTASTMALRNGGQLQMNNGGNSTKTAATNGAVINHSKQYQEQLLEQQRRAREAQSNDDSNESAATTTMAYDEELLQHNHHNLKQDREEEEEGEEENSRRRQLLREQCFKQPYKKGTVGPPTKLALFSRWFRKGCTDDSSAQIVRMRSLEKRKRRLKAKERQATLLLGLILFAFIASWMPFFIMYVLNALHIYTPTVVFKFFFWLGYCNSAINPIIYTYFNREFRRALLRLIRRHQHRFQFLERFSQHEP